VVMNSVTEQSRDTFVETARKLGMTLRTPLRVTADSHNPIEIMAAEVCPVK